jgi:hypothetical protein
MHEPPSALRPRSNLVPELRVLIPQVPQLILRLPLNPMVPLSSSALLVLPPHVESGEGDDDDDSGTAREVGEVTFAVVGCVPWGVCPDTTISCEIMFAIDGA